MSPTTTDTEKADQRPSVLREVSDLADKQKDKQSSESVGVVQDQADAIQGSVADVMGGMEGKVDKGPSERNREDKKGQGSGGSVTSSDDDDDQQAAQIRSGLSTALPTQRIMIRKVRSAINRKIVAEQKKAKKLEKMIAKGKAHEYNKSIARIRSLQEVLKSLVHATFDKVKEMYFHFFTSNKGKEVGSKG